MEYALNFGAGKGIYPIGKNTFYLRNKRPDTLRFSPLMSKLNDYVDSKGKQKRPQTQETTPHLRLLEAATVALQNGDDPFAWAALTLKLCEAATHFGGETALPLPLHLAKMAEEYLHPLPTSEEDTEEGETEEGEE